MSKNIYTFSSVIDIVLKIVNKNITFYRTIENNFPDNKKFTGFIKTLIEAGKENIRIIEEFEHDMTFQQAKKRVKEDMINKIKDKLNIITDFTSNIKKDLDLKGVIDYIIKLENIEYEIFFELTDLAHINKKLKKNIAAYLENVTTFTNSL